MPKIAEQPDSENTPKKTCVICGKKFMGKTTAKTCSNNCRQALMRERKRLAMSEDELRLYDLLKEKMPDVHNSISKLAFMFGQDAAKEGLAIVRSFQRAITQRNKSA